MIEDNKDVNFVDAIFIDKCVLFREKMNVFLKMYVIPAIMWGYNV